MSVHGTVGDQVVGRRLGDIDGHDIAGPDRRLRAGPEVDQPPVARATAHSGGRRVLLARALDHQQFHFGTDQFAVGIQRDLLLQFDQPVVAFLHHRLGDLIGHGARRRAGTNRVLESEGTGEAGLPDHIEGFLEVRFGLAREADDDIGGDGGMRHGGAHLLDDAQEAFLSVGTPHRLEYSVRTGLQRHMQLRAHVRGLRHRLDDIVGELGRMRRGEPHSFQSVDITAGTQQFREGTTVAPLGGEAGRIMLRQCGFGEIHAVGVDVLPQQGHLQHTLIDQCLYFGQHIAGPSVDLLTAQCGHDAEGAGVVATHRDRHPAGVGGFATRRESGRKRLERFEDLHLGLLVVAGTLEQHRQRSDVVGAEHHIDPRRLTHHGVAVLLRQAAADGDLHTGTVRLDRRQMPECPVELVVGVLAHRAGVEHHQVRGLATGRPGVSGVLEQARQPFGVVHIHLAAVGADFVGPLRRRFGGRTGGASRSRMRRNLHGRIHVSRVDAARNPALTPVCAAQGRVTTVTSVLFRGNHPGKSRRQQHDARAKSAHSGRDHSRVDSHDRCRRRDQGRDRIRCRTADDRDAQRGQALR